MNATRSPRATRALFSLMILGAATPLLGCSGVVELQNGYLDDPPGGGGALCGGVVEPEGPGEPRVDLRDPTLGTFIGDRLHLNARVDGVEQYVVLEIAGEAVFVVATPDALEGPAQLVPLSLDTYARMRALDGAWQVDIIDTSSPREPALVASHPLKGEVPPKWQGVLSANERVLYFCLQPEPGIEAKLAALDFSALESPVELEYASDSACRDFFDGGFASGPLWLSWIIGAGIQASQIMSYELSPKGLVKGIDWGYNPSGIHNYGVIKSAVTDGTRVVLDPVSDDWFLLFTATTHPPQGPYTSFPLPGPKRLLTVASQIAYFATPDGVHAFDVSDATAPVLTDYHAEIALDPALTTFLAASPTTLAIADEEGRLYVVPRDRSGKVNPASAYLGPPKSGSDEASACDDSSSD